MPVWSSREKGMDSPGLFSTLSINKMDSILAHNVIHDQGQEHAFHVVGKSLAKVIIVHVNLPIDGVLDCLDRNTYTTRAYLSPFWKSTTEVGTKNP